MIATDKKMQMTNRAYLSLGSNVNPVKNTRNALRLLAQRTNLIAISTFWETAPVGYEKQANFLNGAAIVETELSATALRKELLNIEAKLNRIRQV